MNFAPSSSGSIERQTRANVGWSFTSRQEMPWIWVNSNSRLGGPNEPVLASRGARPLDAHDGERTGTVASPVRRFEVQRGEDPHGARR